jgi:hypothetical protein
VSGIAQITLGVGFSARFVRQWPPESCIQASDADLFCRTLHHQPASDESQNRILLRLPRQLDVDLGLMEAQ